MAGLVVEDGECAAEENDEESETKQSKSVASRGWLVDSHSGRWGINYLLNSVRLHQMVCSYCTRIITHSAYLDCCFVSCRL